MNKMKTIMEFEFLSFIKKKSNWTPFFIACIVSAIVAILPYVQNLFFGENENDITYVYFQNMDIVTNDIDDLVTINNDDELNELLYNGTIDEFYIVTEDNITLYTTKSNNLYTSNSTFLSKVSNVYIEELIEDEEFLEKLNKINYTLDNIERKDIVITSDGYETTDSPEETFYGKFVIGYTLVLITYITMMQFSSYSATTVANEKTSRTMESLIYIVDSSSLIVGKVFAIFLGSVLQLTAIVSVLILGLFLSLNMYSNNSSELVLGISEVYSSITISNILFFIVCCCFAFLSNLFLFASLSSTITKIEELPSAISAGSIVSMFTFFSAIAIFVIPPNLFLEIIPYIPLINPLAMIAKFSISNGTTFDVIYTIIISTITILALAKLASRIYRVGVLYYGTKLTNRELISAILNYKV